jgi:transcriptional regulator with XRE-family HTH domain
MDHQKLDHHKLDHTGKVTFPDKMPDDLFVERLQAHLDHLNADAERGNRITAYKVALEVGLDPTYVTNIFKGRKHGTPETIRRLSASSLLGLSYEQLRSWQVLSHIEPSVIHSCLQEIQNRQLAYDLSQAADNESLPGQQLTSPSTPNTALPIAPIGAPVGGLPYQTTSNGLTAVPFKWQLSKLGFTPLSTLNQDSMLWNLSDIPADIHPELASIHVSDSCLWPPMPMGTVLLVRGVHPPHMLHPNRWYAVQWRLGDPIMCRMVTYDPTMGVLHTMEPASMSVSLSVDTLRYAFEVIQYQVNLAQV